MKNISIDTIRKWIKDGKIECLEDLKIGHICIRWSKTNKREYINVVEGYKDKNPINLTEMGI